MFRRKDIVISTLIICMHLLLVVKAYLKTRISKLPVPSGMELLVDRSSSSSPGMIFGMCSYSGSLRQHNCSLYLETKKTVRTDNHLKNCNITLGPEQDILFGIENVIALGKDKAILQWHSSNMSYVFAILYFSYCEYYIVENDYNISNVEYIFASDDSFSIIMHNKQFQKSSCKNSEFCILTLDDTGDMITGLIPWANGIFYGPIIDIVNSPLKNNLIVDSNFNSTELGYISDGKFVVLKKFIRNNMFEYDITATSKTHNLLTVCYPNTKKEVICGQFDLNGNLKFETQINMPITGYTSLAVFNLPGGGFLIVDDHCVIQDVVEHCDEGFESCFSIRRINSRGATVASRKITCQLQYEPDMDLKKMHFHKNEDGKYCVSYPISRYSYQDRKVSCYIDFDVLCFDQSDLWNY